MTTALLSGARANQRQSYVSSDCPTAPVSCARAQPNSVVRARSSWDSDSDSAYAESLSESQLERARTTLFGWARAQLTGAVGQSLETYDWRWFARAPLNNAVVIAQRLYRMNLNLFEEIYVHSGANLAETIRAIQLRVFTQPGTDPYKALYSRPGLPADD